MSSTPLFTDRSPNDATEWRNQRLKHVVHKNRCCCVLSLARRHSCKPCVKVSATGGVQTVDQGSVGHTDTARNQNCTLPPPIALFKCVGWITLKHQLRVWIACDIGRNGQSLFKCATLPFLTSRILAGMSCELHPASRVCVLLLTVVTTFPVFHYVDTRRNHPFSPRPAVRYIDPIQKIQQFRLLLPISPVSLLQRLVMHS